MRMMLDQVDLMLVFDLKEAKDQTNPLFDPDRKESHPFWKNGDFWCQTQKSLLLVTILPIRHTNTSNEG